MQEYTTIKFNFKELSQIVGIYFSQKLKRPTPTELKILINDDLISFEVKLWIENSQLQVLELEE